MCVVGFLLCVYLGPSGVVDPRQGPLSSTDNNMIRSVSRSLSGRTNIWLEEGWCKPFTAWAPWFGKTQKPTLCSVWPRWERGRRFIHKSVPAEQAVITSTRLTPGNVFLQIFDRFSIDMNSAVFEFKQRALSDLDHSWVISVSSSLNWQNTQKLHFTAPWV